jgi:hypothetical protein
MHTPQKPDPWTVLHSSMRGKPRVSRGGTHCGGDEVVGVGAGGSADHRGTAGRCGSTRVTASEQAGGRGAELHRRHGIGLVEGNLARFGLGHV